MGKNKRTGGGRVSALGTFFHQKKIPLLSPHGVRAEHHRVPRALPPLAALLGPPQGPSPGHAPPLARPARVGRLPRGARPAAHVPARARPVRRGREVRCAERVRGGGAGVGPSRPRRLRRRLVRAVPPHRARRRLGLRGIH